jgi:effector-binding domain-containing protein
MRSRLVRATLPLLCSALCFAPAGGAALAQVPQTPPAATLIQAPAAAPPAAPQAAPPRVPDVAPPLPSPPQAAAPAAPAPGAPPPASQSAGLPSLVPTAGDAGDVDEVVLPAKPVAIMSGQSTWENGLKTMHAAVEHLREELGKAGIAPAGRPVTVFTETSDEGFKYDAMIPVARAPDAPTGLPAEIRFGTTPSGKAYRFVHKGPYDEIDSTYETITAYLDAKDVAAKDSFIEEYLTDTADPTDPALEINIFVQPK